MAVTEDELQEKRVRNAEALAELQRLNDERIAAEQSEATELASEKLDKEYEQIQAAIAQARGLNAQATDQAAEKPVAAAPATVTPPRLETPATATNAEGK